MIEILFPPGCYGTYLARSVYNYTNLRATEYKNFVFGSAGDSHVHRKNLDAKNKIIEGHLPSVNYVSVLSFNDPKNIITILPLSTHKLDYYNNQYYKQYNTQSAPRLTEYIVAQLPILEINQKLKEGWNYTDSLTVDTPRWIFREFLSFWIEDCFNDGYSFEKYNNVPCEIKINTQDIITNIEETIINICQIFDLTINVSAKDILFNHQNFLLSQKYHNSQINCNSWVSATINSSTSMDNPCQTIFDEAYVQSIFRTSGYEIKCHELNQLPSTSLEMKKLIYKI